MSNVYKLSLFVQMMFLVSSGTAGAGDSVYSFASSAERKPATLSIQEIRQSVERYHQKIRNLLVEYQATSSTRGEPGYMPGNYVLRTAAAKKHLRYLRTAHISTDQDLDNDMQLSYSFYDGASFNAYYPYNRLYEVSHRFLHPSSLKARAEPYFESIGWWPPDDHSIPPNLSGHSFFLMEVFAKESCRIVPIQEFIDQRWCHVLEVPGLDRMWIDASNGLLVKRIRYDPVSHRPVMSYELQDYRVVSPCVQLPYLVKRIEYSMSDEGILYEFNYKLIRCEVNSLSDTLFHFVPIPGTIIYDRDKDIARQVPGGFDLLETMSERAKRISNMPSSSYLSENALTWVVTALALLGWSFYALTSRTLRRTHYYSS